MERSKRLREEIHHAGDMINGVGDKIMRSMNEHPHQAHTAGIALLGVGIVGLAIGISIENGPLMGAGLTSSLFGTFGLATQSQ